jgi:energy-coupling factor transport system ATP-binding protein
MSEGRVIQFEFQDLWYAYPGQEPALRGVSLILEPGAFVGLIGQNGSGKTTLAKHFNGLLRPTQGAVFMDGVDIRPTKVSALAASVGYLYQNPDDQIFSSSVREELAFAPRNLGLEPVEIGRRIDALMDYFDLTQYADLPPATLSYGLRRKITAASVFAAQTPLLILDEPTSGLDGNEAALVMDYAVELNRRGCSVVLISHDMHLIAEYARECVVLDRGSILTSGTPDEVFSRPAILREVQLDSPQISKLTEHLSSAGLDSGDITVDGCCRSITAILDAGAAKP